MESRICRQNEALDLGGNPVWALALLVVSAFVPVLIASCLLFYGI